MREALVICPVNDNDGRSLIDTMQRAALELVAAFGGCTIRDSRGAWQSPNTGKLHLEPVWELVAACAPCARSDALLRNVARLIGREGRQEAVYVRLSSGAVEILDTQPASLAS